VTRVRSAGSGLTEGPRNVSARTYVAAFAGLHEIADPDQRRRTTRQGLTMLAQIAEREPAPLEGLPAPQLLLAVRAALADGTLADLDWMPAAAAAIALFELAQALPAGPERRELGRRVLVQLRDADRDTFVRLVTALARSSPKLLASEALRARTEVVLAAPLTAPGAIGELALGLLAQPQLAQSWVEQPAMGSLPARRLAARILAHGAREAVRRFDTGDRGGVAVLARSGTRAALDRLLGDREALVWRFACIARGLLAHVDSRLAADIDRELRPSATSTELRRAAASAAAALDRGGAAEAWKDVLVDRAGKDPGVARGALLGLAGLAINFPTDADALAHRLLLCAPLDVAEAVADLRREEGVPLLPSAAASALAWVREQTRDPGTDDGRLALLEALELELGGRFRSDGVGAALSAARHALDTGDAPTALRHAREAVDELQAAAEWLSEATDDEAVDRRHSMRLLRELDREVLADNALDAVLALAPETDPARAQLAAALGTIEAALLAREAMPEAGPVPHGGLRIARLRALVRLLDGVRKTGEADLAPRLAAVRLLVARSAADQSPLRRAVWAALTRAGDALLRDGHAEVTDLLFAWSTAFPDDDFAIVCEASMIPEVDAAFGAYARLMRAAWAAADPDDTGAVRELVECLADLADALPPEQSPRVEAVRLALARLGDLLSRLSGTSSLRALAPGAFDAIAVELGALSRRSYGAHQRLGLPATDRAVELEAAARAVDAALKDPEALDEAIAVLIDTARAALPPVLSATLERVVVWLAHRPRTEQTAPTAPLEVMLPGWVPLSRLIGGFHVLRPIGRGAGGSVLLAVRAEHRHLPDRELVALKAPDYAAGSRNLSEAEFEALFREEAGALLALPAHPNLARFITFDAASQPKPVLVMEYVRGTTLERALELRELGMKRAFEIIDGVLAGLEAMHRVGIAHLDVKPGNVILRERSGEAVLVDFGLAGRHIRTGCGSPHYGAAEVWSEGGAEREAPFPADVYAAACVAFEILTDALLVGGETLNDVIAEHFSDVPGSAVLDHLRRAPHLAALGQLLRAAIARDPRKRPSVARLRAGFSAIAPELMGFSWPLAV